MGFLSSGSCSGKLIKPKKKVMSTSIRSTDDNLVSAAQRMRSCKTEPLTCGTQDYPCVESVQMELNHNWLGGVGRKPLSAHTLETGVLEFPKRSTVLWFIRHTEQSLHTVEQGASAR